MSEIKRVFLPSEGAKPLKYLTLATTGRLRLLAAKDRTVSVVQLLAGEDAARKKTKNKKATATHVIWK